MTTTDIIGLVITIIGVASFAAVVTILFRSYIKSAIKEINFGQRDIEIVDLVLYESDENVIRKKKAVEVGKSIAYYAFLAVLIPLFGLSLYSRIKNNVTKIGDQIVMVVASGSMSMKNEANTYLANINNQFNTYDMITLSPVSSAYALKQYDVIAYVNDKGINVIHRIIDIKDDSEGRRFVTRGDSNNASDSYMPRFKDIIGKYTNKRIPAIGIFIMFFQSYAGIVTVLSVVYCSLMISFFNKKLEQTMENRRELLEKAFDTKSLALDDPELMSSSCATCIYFKGYAYCFRDDQFIEKREMTEDEKEKYNNNQNEPVKQLMKKLLQI